MEEIAAVIPGDGTERRSDHRDIVVWLRGGSLKHISHLHQSYSTLHYTMLFLRVNVVFTQAFLLAKVAIVTQSAPDAIMHIGFIRGLMSLLLF